MKNVKLSKHYPPATNGPMVSTQISGICGYMELHKHTSVYAPRDISLQYLCDTHYYNKLSLAECIECLCQSAELLKGKLK